MSNSKSRFRFRPGSIPDILFYIVLFYAIVITVVLYFSVDNTPIAIQSQYSAGIVGPTVSLPEGPMPYMPPIDIQYYRRSDAYGTGICNCERAVLSGYTDRHSFFEGQLKVLLESYAAYYWENGREPVSIDDLSLPEQYRESWISGVKIDFKCKDFEPGMLYLAIIDLKSIKIHLLSSSPEAIMKGKKDGSNIVGVMYRIYGSRYVLSEGAYTYVGD